MTTLQGKKIIVTGGAGFIGSHIVDALIAQGAIVTIIDDFSSGSREHIPKSANVSLVEGSITDMELLKRNFAGADAVVHQAAIPSVPQSITAPLKTHEVNATGTLTVFEAARIAGIRRIVYASSSSVYGDAPVSPKIETMQPLPLSPYAGQKLSGELYASIYAKLHGLEAIGLRYFNVYGPRQSPNSAYAAVIPKFISLMRAGKSPTIYGDGMNSRDFVYVADVVQANVRALLTTTGFGDVYNVAGGEKIYIKQIVAFINEECNTHIEPIYAPAAVGDIRESVADITKAQTVLQYAPAIRFRDGLRQTIASFIPK